MNQENPDIARHVCPSWDELCVGQELEARRVGPITRTDIVRYQGASGDMNPIHHDEPFAHGAGHPAPIVVGMLPAGMLCAWAAEKFGPDNLRHARMRWKEPVWPGDVLELSARISRLFEEGTERKVELELGCKRSTGGTAVQAWATFVVLT